MRNKIRQQTGFGKSTLGKKAKNDITDKNIKVYECCVYERSCLKIAIITSQFHLLSLGLDVFQ